MMAVAELEAGMISVRAARALEVSAAVPARLRKPPRNIPLELVNIHPRNDGRLKRTSTPASRIRDRKFCERARRALNDGDVPTPSGEGTWTAATVARLRQRLELS
jgi:hypothetical protein